MKPLMGIWVWTCERQHVPQFIGPWKLVAAIWKITSPVSWLSEQMGEAGGMRSCLCSQHSCLELKTQTEPLGIQITGNLGER